MDIPSVRKKLDDLTALITQRTKELNQLKKEKKETEALLEDLHEASGTYSFNETQSFPWTKELHSKLVDVFGIRAFRGLQETVINCTLSNKDCIYVAATGSGKSLVFQLPALISSGITLVVSPLLSLMEDQTSQLDQLGIPSIVLNSSTSKQDAKRATSAMVDYDATLKLIYVTPEKLAKSKYFMSVIERMYAAGRFSRLVIDEVHCCSEWGHDFRKDYSLLHLFKRQYPETPILGLTATATPRVLLDIKKMLNIPRCQVFKGSFYRPNLFYEIRASETKDNIPDMVNLITGRFYRQSGIIYCLSIKDTEDVASKLSSMGVSCQAYHAQLDPNMRTKIQRQWYNDECNVIAATVAFGLGINKMNVRFVIHFSISKSLENYYQETGRAGRDGKPAYCICYYRFSDVFRATSLTFRERDGKERVYQMLTFCLNRHDCRKKLIAEYFQDNLVKSRDDKECCDNCLYKRAHFGGNGTNDWIDASDWLTNLLEILANVHRKDESVTANKLIDLWLQVRGSKRLRLEGANRPSLNRLDGETIVGLLLSRGYLQEKFHITPYNTISYIKPGIRGINAERPLIHRGDLDSLNVCPSPRTSNLPPQSLAQTDVKPRLNHRTKAETKQGDSSDEAEVIDLDQVLLKSPKAEISGGTWSEQGEIECWTID